MRSGAVSGRRLQLRHVERRQQVVTADRARRRAGRRTCRPSTPAGRSPARGHPPAHAARSARRRRTRARPRRAPGPSARATSLMVPRALLAAPMATSRVRGVTARSKSSQSSCPRAASQRTHRSVTPRSRATACQGATLAWWSSSVTTISSPGPQPRPSARPTWNARVVMLLPKAISDGAAFRKSASARRASSSSWSVSRLVGKCQCVLALWCRR